MTVSFVSGQALAASARRSLADEPNIWFNKPLYISLLWMALLYAPSAMFFYHGWTDWNIMYAFDSAPLPDRSPTLLSSIVIWLDATILISLFLGGFALAHHWIRKRQMKRILVASLGGSIALVVFLAIFYHRGFIVTTYAEFAALPDQGIVFRWGGDSFWGSDAFWANSVIAFIDFGPLAFLLYWFNKRGREA